MSDEIGTPADEPIGVEAVCDADVLPERGAGDTAVALVGNPNSSGPAAIRDVDDGMRGADAGFDVACVAEFGGNNPAATSVCDEDGGKLGFGSGRETRRGISLATPSMRTGSRCDANASGALSRVPSNCDAAFVCFADTPAPSFGRAADADSEMGHA